MRVPVDIPEDVGAYVEGGARTFGAPRFASSRANLAQRRQALGESSREQSLYGTSSSRILNAQGPPPGVSQGAQYLGYPQQSYYQGPTLATMIGYGYGGEGLAQDPGLAWVQQQHLVQKAHVSQELIALQREGLMRQRDVAVAGAAVQQAQRVLHHARALQKAVAERITALNRHLTALDVAQRRASDQAQLRALTSALAEAKAAGEAVQGASAGHEDLVQQLEARAMETRQRVKKASGEINRLLQGKADEGEEAGEEEGEGTSKEEEEEGEGEGAGDEPEEASLLAVASTETESEGNLASRSDIETRSSEREEHGGMPMESGASPVARERRNENTNRHNNQELERDGSEVSNAPGAKGGTQLELIQAHAVGRSDAQFDGGNPGLRGQHRH